MPVAGEWDGWLNDLNGFHVKEEHVFSAIDAAASGPVQEGSVGGGSGMINYEFKGGSGTSSRVVDLGAAGTYTVGVFLQANFGRREQLVIAGVPVGRKFPLTTDANPYSASTSKVEVGSQGNGSLIAILGTDAPLVPHQLKRLARRIPIGVARTGTSGDNGSGDVFLAFTTANAESLAPGKDAAELATVKMLPDKFMDPLFEAVAEVVEEAILNVLCAGETTIGRDGHVVPEMPIDAVLDYMKALGRDKWN
ncbi:DmpA/ArgJ-like protein [Gonapodya prolifera JEL478]|uniref:DmpA/ArgJ-like protein n=1 Tax=Gonapodya prolifera (strain JEL478) TaxID=1344416 RepID=A0A139A1D4_GONPJ|nr:DmpA/ArgJ-like protein [Gonapodya prolifera JEL478]|eukprot:KXS10597.1 DmpA/ArgJ-like protein [Gonapodya prolifera JEL478]